jgi:hypothetical protein
MATIFVARVTIRHILPFYLTATLHRHTTRHNHDTQLKCYASIGQL